MFTIKLYSHNGSFQRIFQADDFSIQRSRDGVDGMPPAWCEITLHRKTGDDFRVDIGASPYTPTGGVWEKAIIENAAGKTTEIIGTNIPPRADDQQKQVA